jgi:hypothetical protein
MLRRVYPAVDARPLDLFPTNGRMKPIWDLKISHLGRDYDVVGVFNYDEDQRQQTKLQWKDFGLDADQLVHVFDFWNQEYLGSWETGMMVDVPPTSVRVLTLLPADEKIQLISTNRHITQGWVDLEELTASDDGKSFAGRSKVIRDDPYDLVFAFPRGEGWAVKTATAETASGPVATEVSNHQGWARVRCMSDETTEIHWRVEFEPADLYYYRPEPVTNLRVAADGLNGATLEWNELYWLNAGYKVYLNGEPLGYTPRSAIALENLDPTVTYTAEVATVWDDGSESERKPEIEFTLASLLPTAVRLTTLEPAPTNEGRRFGGGAATGDLTIGETRFADAILGRSVVYELHGVFARFTAKIGASSAARNDASDNTGGNTTSGAELPKLRFVVVADGKEVFNQEVAADGELHDVDVEIAGAKQLALRIEGEQRAGRRRGRRRGAQVPTSAWIDAQVIRGDAPRGNAAN